MHNVSVILPTYNRSKFITETIESVINQTYSDWELLIIDDFSTDDTEAVINKLILKFSNNKIKYFKNVAKKGVSGARNTGMQYAEGRYIAFLDSDDLWDKDNLKLKMETLNDNSDIDVILSDNHVFGEVEERYIKTPQINGIFSESFWDRRNNILSVAQELIMPFIFKHGFSFRIQTLLFKKDILLKTGGFDENMIFFEDAEFMFKCFCAGKFAYLHKKLCSIRRHSLNTANIYSNNVKAESELLFVKSTVNYATKFNVGIEKPLLKEVLRDAYIRRATRWFKNGNLGEARKCIFESIRIKFSIKAILRLLALYIISLFPKNKKRLSTSRVVS